MRVMLEHPVVIIPWRDRGDEHRRANLKLVNHTLQSYGWPVIVCSDGRVGDAPFCRSAAYNNGIAACPKANAYIFHEADILTSPAALETAVTMACSAPGLVVPFDTYYYLSEQVTARALRGEVNPLDAPYQRKMSGGTSTGAINVVSAHTMAAVGRWDEQLSGWGYDDRAMVRAFQVATGCPTRFVAGAATHLWHTPGWAAGGKFAGGVQYVPAEERNATAANARRYRLYEQARTPEQIRALTAGKVTA